MTAQLSREWLQKTISDIETMRDEMPFGLDEDGNNTLAAFKLALAGMESEPFCRISAIEKVNIDKGVYAVVDIPSRHPSDMPLYAAPPAPGAVSDGFIIPEVATLTNINQLCPLDVNLSQTDFATGWNECRNFALANNAIPAVVKGISAYCQGCNACRAAMQAEHVTAVKVQDDVRNALTLALQAMEFMGDTLNSLDAVCTEDVEQVTPAFEAVRKLLAALPAAPEQEV